MTEQSRERWLPSHSTTMVVGRWRARARSWAPASRRLRGDLLRLAGRGLPTECGAAESDSAHVPGCRHARAVLPCERGEVGGRAARCRCGCGHARAGRIARRCFLAKRVPADDSVGVWTRIEYLLRIKNMLKIS